MLYSSLQLTGNCKPDFRLVQEKLPTYTIKLKMKNDLSLTLVTKSAGKQKPISPRDLPEKRNVVEPSKVVQTKSAN